MRRAKSILPVCILLAAPPVGSAAGSPGQERRAAIETAFREAAAAADREAAEEKEKTAAGLVWYGSGWVKPEEAQRLRAEDRKSCGWESAFRFDTGHLAVQSARPLAFTRKLAAILESEIGAYRRLYGEIWNLSENPPRMTLHLFGDPETYVRVSRAPAGSAGFYSPANAVMYVAPADGRSGQEDAQREAAALGFAVHEFVHALDDLWAGRFRDLPPWLAEGRADGFRWGFAGRTFFPGAVFMIPGGDRLEFLKKPGSIPFADLARFGWAEFNDMKTAGPRYSAAWTWSHFLQHADAERARKFNAFLALPKGKLTPEGFRETMGDVDALQRTFEAWVAEKFLPGLAAAPAKPAEPKKR